MRIKLTLFLFFANIAVFGLIFYLDSTRSQLPEKSLPGIIGPEIETATSLTIAGRLLDGQEELKRSFVYEDQRWYLETPFRWPANPNGISRMFSSLIFLEPEIRFSVSEIEAAGKSLADYGLDPARIELSFGMPDQEDIELKIGAPTEVGNRLYVLSPDGSEILVTSSDLLKALAVDLNSIRDRRIFDIPDFEVRELVTRFTETGDITVRLKKEAEGWRFEAPIEVEADMELVRTTLQQLTRLEAQHFPDTLAPEDRLSTIAEPRIRITLEGNDRRETLIIGGEAPIANGERTYYAEREDRSVVVTVPAAPFDQLLEAQSELRERDFLKFNPEKLTGLEIARSSVEEGLVLKRLETGSWQVVDRGEDASLVSIAADVEVVDRLLKNLDRIEALEFVRDVPTQSDLETYGLTEPSWTLKFQNAEGPDRTLLVGARTRLPAGRQAFFVKLEDERFVYAVPSDVARLWILDPLYYRDRTLQSLGKAVRIERVLVEKIGDGVETLRDESIDLATETWGTYLESWLVEEQGPFWDLIGQFRDFEVAAFLENSFSADGYQSLAESYPWTLKVSLSLALPGDGDSFKTLVQTFYFTDRVSGSFQAGGSPDFGSMFQVEPAMIENLYTLFLERPTSVEFDVEAAPEEAGVEEPAAEPDTSTATSDENLEDGETTPTP
ncbi:MAG: DUF4340 domain-containing protein [Opitutales bacterium]